MPRCSFCSKQIQGGITFISLAGKIYYFCSSKCHKNWKLGRDAKKVRWVKKEKRKKR